MRRGLTALTLVFLLAGCSRVVKQRTTIPVPPAIAQARSAGPEELIDLVNQRYAALSTLKVSSFEVEFQGGSLEQGFLEKYPRARGYLVAEDPASILVNILNPLTNSTIAVMAAQDTTFEIWLPRENKFVVGQTTVQLEEKNPIYNVRPDHLLKGILIEKVPVGLPGIQYFVEEDQDETAKYYVLGVIRLGNSGRDQAMLERRIWIERSRMNLARQRYYDQGRVVSTISYGEPMEVGDLLVSRRVKVERSQENYTIEMLFETSGVSLNEPIKEGAFEIPQPAGAEVIVVEKREEGEQTDRE